jgi:hypothetical protein
MLTAEIGTNYPFVALPRFRQLIEVLRTSSNGDPQTREVCTVYEISPAYRVGFQSFRYRRRVRGDVARLLVTHPQRDDLPNSRQCDLAKFDRVMLNAAHGRLSRSG